MSQYDSSVVPSPVLEAAIASGDAAIRGLLAAGLTRERVASLAGKLIDHIGRQLEEEKRAQELRLERERAARETALGKLLAKEQRKRQRKRKNGKLATDRHG